MDNLKNTDRSSECVIFIHGLGRSRMSFNKMEKRFAAAGYRTLNVNYPSTRHGIKELAENYVWPAVEAFRPSSFEKIHFITHSLGGIILRFILAGRKLANLGRVVMLAPPSHGSRLADALGRFGFFRYWCGPALLELGHGESDIANGLKPPDFEFGVITGDVSLNPLFSYIIGEPSDGKVAIEEARIDGMADFLVVKRSHTFIMRANEVIKAAMNFIASGKFGA